MMILNIKNTSIFLVILVGTLLALALQQTKRAGNKPVQEVTRKVAHVVEISDNGFVPTALYIRQGEMVRFTTKKNEPFWPASNLHPTHEIYPEFDPKKPVAPEESWSFTFDKPGEWKYHDHLRPALKGVVVVLESSGKKASYECGKISKQDEQKRRQCWEEVLTATLNKEGVDSAFDLIVDLYEREPSFTEGCHGYSHTIGEKAYELFSGKKDFTLSAKTSYCGYGFFHGFMEALLNSKGSVTDAKRFCEMADKELSVEAPLTRLNCFHGIGHGMADPHNPKLWGKAQAMAEPALALCEKISNNRTEIDKCLEGVFNETSLAFIYSLRGLFLDRNDPLAFCRNQLEAHQPICFHEFVMLLRTATNDDFAKSASFVKNISDYRSTEPAMRALASTFVSDVSKFDPSIYVPLCRTISEALRLPCIRGYVVGFIAHGQPGIEYAKALEFCSLPVLKEDERQLCYKHALSMAAQIYSREKTDKICSGVNEKYRKFCEVR